MRGKTDKVAFCANTEEGTMDELILDFFEKNYEFNANIDRRDLWERHGGKGREIQIEFAELKKLFSVVEDTFHQGEFYFEDKYYEARQEENRQWKMRQKRRELVSKERLWQAIKWECEEDELRDLCSYDRYRYDKDNYYDFALILDKIHAFMAGERSVEYFTSWLVLMMRCLLEGMICNDSRKKEIYDKIADLFDGAAFMPRDISEEEKRVDCLETIAFLKDLDFQLKNIGAKKNTPFTKNGVATYVSFNAFVAGGEGNELYKVCVADEDRETVNYLFVSDLVCNEEINYTFLTEAEFVCLTSTYYEYSLDRAMKEDYAMTKYNRR